ncbi:DUF2243 domain-containing protein [Nocardia sp. NPDC003979]|nr:Predicted membrane protein [Nocardia asteroides]VEG36375.1 Predicted membrane protein [Nocardia asteroides]
MMPRDAPTPPHGLQVSTPLVARSVWSGVLVGIGTASFIDETVFHQLLHWHHFYDKSTTSIGLVSDGLFHAFGFFAVVIGLVMVADLIRRAGLSKYGLAAGIFLGLGVMSREVVPLPAGKSM